MKKKFFAVALATTMALSTAISASAETLTGTAWWTGMQTGQDYTLNGNGSVTLSVKVTDGEGPAFSVEAYDPGADGAAGGNDGYYMTCGSDGNIWFAELANGEGVNVTKNPFAAAGDVAAGTIEVGKTYEVTVTRNGKDFTVTYKNEDGTTLYDMAGTSAVEFPETIKVHVMAQVGTIEVTEGKAGGSETPTDNSGTTAAPANNNSTTAAPAATTTAAKSSSNTATKTGDVAPITALAAVAVVACAAVVVSRKKVTE